MKWNIPTVPVQQVCPVKTQCVAAAVSLQVGLHFRILTYLTPSFPPSLPPSIPPLEELLNEGEEKDVEDDEDEVEEEEGAELHPDDHELDLGLEEEEQQFEVLDTAGELEDGEEEAGTSSTAGSLGRGRGIGNGYSPLEGYMYMYMYFKCSSVARGISEALVIQKNRRDSWTNVKKWRV